MPTPITRQRMTIDEALGVQPESPQEVTLPRTENLDDSLQPNWEAGLRQFELGLHNAEADTTSNMVVDKVMKAAGPWKLSEVIELLDNQYEFILNLITKLLMAGFENTRGVKNAVQAKISKKE